MKREELGTVHVKLDDKLCGGGGELAYQCQKDPRNEWLKLGSTIKNRLVRYKFMVVSSWVP